MLAHRVLYGKRLVTRWSATGAGSPTVSKTSWAAAQPPRAPVSGFPVFLRSSPLRTQITLHRRDCHDTLAPRSFLLRLPARPTWKLYVVPSPIPGWLVGRRGAALGSVRRRTQKPGSAGHADPNFRPQLQP